MYICTKKLVKQKVRQICSNFDLKVYVLFGQNRAAIFVCLSFILKMGSERLLSLYSLISGYSKPFSAQVKARLSNDLNLDPRPEYSRVILTWNGNDPVANVESTGNQVNSNF